MTDISNSDDIIDSRDIIARIDELQTEIDDAYEDAGDQWDDMSEEDRAGITRDQYVVDHGGNLTADARKELKLLQRLAEEGERYADDWKHGVALIRDSHFQEYARELAEDCGMIKADAIWPNNCIDWKQAARELRMDYTSIEFDGVTYWVR
jgi:hypothetical protein